MPANRTAGAVVVALDADAPVEEVLTAAAELASGTDRPLHVVNATGVGVVPWSADMLARQETKLTHLRERLHALSGVPVTSETALESAAKALVAASDGASAVVLGAGRLGRLSAEALGATTHQVAAHARCPVLVVPRGHRSSRHGVVLVGVDAREDSVPAVAAAFAEASRRSVPLVAVHAWWLSLPGAFDDRSDWTWDEEAAHESERVALAEMVAGWGETYPDVEVRTEVRRGEPVPVLRDAAKAAQLLVVGTRGRGGFAGLLLGGVSSRLVHDSPCPLLVVPSRPRVPAGAPG